MLLGVLRCLGNRAARRPFRNSWCAVEQADEAVDRPRFGPTGHGGGALRVPALRRAPGARSLSAVFDGPCAAIRAGFVGRHWRSRISGHAWLRAWRWTRTPDLCCGRLCGSRRGAVASFISLSVRERVAHGPLARGGLPA